MRFWYLQIQFIYELACQQLMWRLSYRAAQCCTHSFTAQPAIFVLQWLNFCSCHEKRSEVFEWSIYAVGEKSFAASLITLLIATCPLTG